MPDRLRRVVGWKPTDERQTVLLANHFGSGATTLADIYRHRRKVKLSFEALKQTLKPKPPVGRSENAFNARSGRCLWRPTFGLDMELNLTIASGNAALYA